MNSHGLQGYYETFKSWFMPSQSVRFTQNQTNNENLSYRGDVYLGTPNDGGSQQSSKVIWDTGSGALLVRSTLCSTCTGNKFDVTRSSTLTYTSSYDSVSYLGGG